jgi:hypothetical protein
MQVSAFAIFASFLLLVAPTAAQTTNLSSPPLDVAVTLDTQQKLKQSLEKNRFKNVVVIPEADVIRAQAPDGSKIIIEITPDHVTGVLVGSGSSADQTTMHSPRSGGDFE